MKLEVVNYIRLGNNEPVRIDSLSLEKQKEIYARLTETAFNAIGYEKVQDETEVS